MLLGSQISLGPIVPADFPSLFCWANDIDAMRHDTAYRPVDFVQHTQWCEAIGKDTSMVVFAIRRLGEAAIVGYVKLSNINAVHRCADFGIRIGTEAHRDRGYGKDATALALSFCWNHLNLNRVQLIVFGHNARAARVYAACGFEREGLMRRAAFVNGEWIDLAIMAALRPAQEQDRAEDSIACVAANAPLAAAMPLVSVV
jgi:RimJ/RimL family protein N-acetyltransferase